MKVITSYTPDSLAFIDELLPAIRKVMVSFFTARKNDPFSADGFGSGFIVSYKGVRFLITALHVVELAKHYDACVIRICDQAVLFEKVGFFRDEENDIAIALIDDFLMINKITGVPALELDDDEEQGYLDHHLLVGYPGTKNRIQPRRKKTASLLLSITAQLATANTLLKTKITNKLLFNYNHKSQLNSDLTKANQPPDLQGMSGGPSLKVKILRQLDNNMEVDIRLSGVLVEWHKPQRMVVAAHISSVITCIEETIAGPRQA